MAKERLDKLISSQSMMTRSEATKLIRSGVVTVNGAAIKNTSLKADPSTDDIRISGTPFIYKKHIYIMMNKPDGIVSASRDPKEKTVIDIIPDSLKRTQQVLCLLPMTVSLHTTFSLRDTILIKHILQKQIVLLMNHFLRI